MEELEMFRERGRELYDSLRLASYPVAIKYIKDEAEIEPGMMRPSDSGQKLSLCQAFTYSRRWGATVAMTDRDNFCVPSTAIHRWVDVPYEDFVQSQVTQGWHRDEEAERKRSERVRLLFEGEIKDTAGEYVGFISSPLPATMVKPDTVLVYGSGEDITHVTHALTYGGENFPASTFEGFGESCVKGGLLPFLTGVPQVVIPGMGDRSLTGTYDYEIAIGFPARLLDTVVEDLFKSGGAMNMGKPLHTMVVTGLTESVTPGFKFLRDRIDASRDEGGNGAP